MIRAEIQGNGKWQEASGRGETRLERGRKDNISNKQLGYRGKELELAGKSDRIRR